MPNAIKTIVVAFILCVVCSILVSTTAIQLRPIQQKNVEVDMKKNILMAAGLVDLKATEQEILSAFEEIEPVVLDFETGEKVEEIDPASYNMDDAEKNSETSVKIPKNKDIGGLSTRAKYAKIYLKKDEEGNIDKIILPVKGKGLWSTMYGFLALEEDTKTVAGFGYYKQGETPGLGAEVENPKWKKQWEGLEVLNEEGEPVFRVEKGGAEKEHAVDALSGATITGNGVQHSTNYWLGDHGYGKILEKIRTEGTL